MKGGLGDEHVPPDEEFRSSSGSPFRSIQHLGGINAMAHHHFSTNDYFHQDNHLMSINSNQ